MHPRTHLTALILILAATPAAAHPGHFAELAGHSHWIALGALAAAGVLAGWLATKGKKEEAEDDNEADAEEADA
ncbi:MAG: DUF6732 family protein [Pseudomonadota bacterium]